jgi:molybdate transport system substrate-binding protein
MSATGRPEREYRRAQREGTPMTFAVPMHLRALLLAVAMVVSTAASAQESVRVFAAGSLRAAMTELARAFTASGGPAVTTTFGASGLLRERIEKGEGADVFASADIGNAVALARANRAVAPVVFARNRLCALLAPGVDATPETLLDRMLDPRIKLGTSTPKADPSGDYAWQLFEKAEKLRTGAYAALDKKALKLVGGADSPQPPPGRSLYGILIAEGKAEIFLTYCTNAVEAAREVVGARVLTLPDPLAVGASYALTVLTPARPGADRFALYVMSISGQEILTRNGFASVGLP